MKRLTIYSDGASKGNPGDAGVGVVISNADGVIVREIAEYIGKTTNNVAEYTALIHGLVAAHDLGATHVDICADSELLVRQLTGVYKVKSPNLQPLFEQLVALLRSFEKATITHVVREYNKRADELANKAVKKHRQDARNSSIASDGK
ncbi:MAG: ribonuclease HI family protein [Armatimonadota bacterium]|jgi:ribonuclease HI